MTPTVIKYGDYHFVILMNKITFYFKSYFFLKVLRNVSDRMDELAGMYDDIQVDNFILCFNVVSQYHLTLTPFDVTSSTG